MMTEQEILDAARKYVELKRLEASTGYKVVRVNDSLYRLVKVDYKQPQFPRFWRSMSSIAINYQS